MREVSKTTGNDGGDGIWYHLGQASSLAFNAALVACAKVSIPALNILYTW